MTLRTLKMPSPVGELTLYANDSGLTAIIWRGDRPARVRLGPAVADEEDAVLREARTQLSAYFAGTLTAFTVPLDFQGTEFQKAVWRALLAIPFGETRSYGEIARDIGRPSASRAVGAANGRNPISIIAPCHRVIGASGALTGFAGGLEAKALLLEHERSVRSRNEQGPHLGDGEGQFVDDDLGEEIGADRAEMRVVEG